MGMTDRKVRIIAGPGQTVSIAEGYYQISLSTSLRVDEALEVTLHATLCDINCVFISFQGLDQKGKYPFILTKPACLQHILKKNIPIRLKLPQSLKSREPYPQSDTIISRTVFPQGELAIRK